MKVVRACLHIERVYRHLKEDRAVMDAIEKIKSHPWVRIIEGT